MPRPVSIVIPSFNGLELLEAHLPSVLGALEGYPQGGELIVVDDGSADRTADWLADLGSSVKCLKHDRNRGFASAASSGILAARHEIVILLNSDVEVRQGFIAPLVDALQPEDVFAVQSVSLREDGRTVDENVKVPYFRMEKLRFAHFRGLPVEKLQESVPDPLPTFFASGGFMALKADLFRRLGGFDPLFEPFYYEDVDLSYRAWKRGWRVLFEPRSVVVHHHTKSSILSHQSDGRVQTVMKRNRFLFTWKNITSPLMFWVRHVLPLLLRTPLKLLLLDVPFYNALIEAFGRLRSVREGRRREKKEAVRSDREVFRIIRGVAPPGVR